MYKVYPKILTKKTSIGRKKYIYFQDTMYQYLVDLKNCNYMEHRSIDLIDMYGKRLLYTANTCNSV